MAQALCAALGVECLFWSTSETSDALVRGENGDKKVLLFPSSEGNATGHCNFWSLYRVMCRLPALVVEGVRVERTAYIL